MAWVKIITGILFTTIVIPGVVYIISQVGDWFSTLFTYLVELS